MTKNEFKRMISKEDMLIGLQDLCEFIGSDKNETIVYKSSLVDTLELLSKEKIITYEKIGNNTYKVNKYIKEKVKREPYLKVSDYCKLKQSQIDDFLAIYPKKVLKGCLRVVDEWKFQQPNFKPDTKDFQRVFHIEGTSRSGWALEKYAKLNNTTYDKLTNEYLEKQVKNIKKVEEVEIDTSNVSEEDLDELAGLFG